MKRIIINGELTDLNNFINSQRNNKFGGNNLKRKNTNICRLAALEAMSSGLFISAEEMPLDINFKWYVPSKRKDKDNTAFAKKFILDGMVEAGLLTNDGWQQIGNFTDRFYIDKTAPRIEIELITK